MNERKQGRITLFVPTRNFGFLICPDGQRVFFHGSNFIGTPVLSQEVSFELGPPIKEGQPLQAVKVSPVAGLADLATVVQ
jgi:cold shock CspA family protein